MAFASVRSEGLLPLDILQEVLNGEAEGQRPQDFGLPRERRVVDEAAMLWQAALYQWREFRRRVEALPESDRGTSLTRSHWMELFLRLLGYELQHAPRAARIDGASFPISHRAVPERGWSAERLEEAPPVHVVSFRHSLDRRAEGERLSPQAMLQDYLNRSDHVWGIVANGLSLRLLRRSAHLARPSYLEFDLERMLEGEHFADFVLLYRLLHRSRLPPVAAESDSCLLERYYQRALEQGGRVRERLREGVERALKTLGSGFLRHPDNARLRAALEQELLTPAGLYQQLLRLVYRLLFLMVAEERGLLCDHPVYQQHYSLRRLRDLCERPFADDRHHDLYESLKVAFAIFRNGELAALFDAAPLDGELFAKGSVEHLEEARLYNADLLRAMRHLSLFREREGATLRRVNYAALDVEELGSVYESLLELEPLVRREGGHLVFDFGQGGERKSTGSYYTPPELVKELVESALVPVLEERLRAARTRKEQERAILEMNVCDPACGSGHFLLAAARRLGRELARVRTGEEEPPADEYRRAVRDVIARCIYGVDKNPLAVELCRVALWIEGHNRGLPLTFLDHRIRLGDSLVGVADLNALADGIPDEAYDRDDPAQKPLARALKQRNRQERRGQLRLEEPLDDRVLGLGLQWEELERIPDDSPEAVAGKARHYDSLRGEGSEWWRLSTACHLWTMPFFAELAPERPVPTTHDLRRYLGDGATDARLVGEAWGLAFRHRFFHWPLEFPDVFAGGGFDVILCNPPFGAAQSNSIRRTAKQLGYPTSNTNTAVWFIYRAMQLLRASGRMGLVSPKSLTYSARWAEVRQMLAPHLVMVRDCGEAWKEVRLEEVVFVACKGGTGPLVDVGAVGKGVHGEKRSLPRSMLNKMDIIPCELDELTVSIVARLNERSRSLGSMCKTVRGLGIQRMSGHTAGIPVVGGQNLARYCLRGVAGYIPDGVRPKINIPPALLAPKVMYQNIVAYVTKPKPHIKITACFDDAGVIPLDTVNVLLPVEPVILPNALVALLNSKVFNWLAWRVVFNKAVRTMHLDQYFLDRLPVPLEFLEAQDKLASMVTYVLSAVAKSDPVTGDAAAVIQEIDDFVASLYRLSEAERKLVLSDFPQVEL